MKGSTQSLARDRRGAVYVEQMIAYLPVMFFFMATWQLLELCAAHLIVKRAASAAARAAIVVLPDDPAFYDGVAKDSFSGKRKEDIELAAAMILATSPHFTSDFKVEVPSGLKGSAPLTATVKAKFFCFAGWVSLVCGPTGVRELSAKSVYAYHGAAYSYDL
jgi:Flp pilus assembly protein TadG